MMVFSGPVQTGEQTLYPCQWLTTIFKTAEHAEPHQPTLSQITMHIILLILRSRGRRVATLVCYLRNPLSCWRRKLGISAQTTKRPGIRADVRHTPNLKKSSLNAMRASAARGAVRSKQPGACATNKVPQNVLGTSLGDDEHDFR